MATCLSNLLNTFGFCGAGIKAIKLYAWEQPYIDRINQLREAELKMIRKAAFYQIFNTIMFGGGPILVSLASFGAFTMLGYPLTASVAFPALALFNLLRFPVMMFPNQIMNIIAAKVALDRIQKYMQVGWQLFMCSVCSCLWELNDIPCVGISVNNNAQQISTNKHLCGHCSCLLCACDASSSGSASIFPLSECVVWA